MGGISLDKIVIGSISDTFGVGIEKCWYSLLVLLGVRLVENFTYNHFL